MNAKAAKRIRYAVRCMGLKHEPTKVKRSTLFSNNDEPAQACYRTRTITRLKREYKALPFHRRDVPQESHSFVLQVKHGNATRRFPA